MRSVYWERLILGSALIGLILGLSSASAQTVFLWDKVWKYNNLNADLGTAWRARTYVDTSWLSGPGILTGQRTEAWNYEDLTATYNGQKRTPVTITNAWNTTTRTIYFRTTFDVGSTYNKVLVATNILDDGAVFYINGVEVGRAGMPASPATVVFATEASRADDFPSRGVDVLTFMPTNLTSSGNVLAVECHQGGGNSSDLVFGMTLTAKVLTPPEITVHPTNQTAYSNLTFSLNVVATGDLPLTYQWQKDTGLLGAFVNISGAVSATYTVASPVASSAGNYRVTVSNLGGSLTSTVATVTVLADTIKPVLLYATARPYPDPGLDPYKVDFFFSEAIGTNFNGAKFTIKQVNSQITLSNKVSGLPSGNRNTLAVEAWKSNVDYTVTVNNLRDRAGNLMPTNTEVGLGFTTKNELLLMDAFWRWYENGDISFYDPNGSWKTNHMDALIASGNAAEGQGLFFFEPDIGSLTNLCGGSKGQGMSGGLFAYYFTTTFILPTVSPKSQIELRAVVDDGVVYYLNGSEVSRYNMPAGPISYETPALTAIGNSSCLTNVFSVSNLLSGENVLSAEVHQTGLQGSDSVFGMEMYATLTSFYTVKPKLYVDKVGNQALLYWSGPGMVLEYSNDVVGNSNRWLRVEAPNQLFVPLTSAEQRFWRLREK